MGQLSFGNTCLFQSFLACFLFAGKLTAQQEMHCGPVVGDSWLTRGQNLKNQNRKND